MRRVAFRDANAAAEFLPGAAISHNVAVCIYRSVSSPLVRRVHNMRRQLSRLLELSLLRAVWGGR